MATATDRLGLPPEIPNVDDRLAGGKRERTVNGMRSAQDDYVGARQGLFQRHQRGVLHVRVGAENLASLHLQEFAQFVRKAIALFAILKW
jgi:hypothetical protein